MKREIWTELQQWISHTFLSAEHRAVMEVAFVYGTVHQFVLTTEATLLKDARYVQTHTPTHTHQVYLLPCTDFLVSHVPRSNLALASLLACMGEKSVSLEVNLSVFKASKCCQACNALGSLLASCWAIEQMISSQRSAWGPPGYLGISFPTSWQCWPFSAPLDVNKLRTYICILHLKVKVHPRMVIRVTAKDGWWDLFCFFQNWCCLCSWVWTSHCWLLIDWDFIEEPTVSLP